MNTFEKSIDFFKNVSDKMVAGLTRRRSCLYAYCSLNVHNGRRSHWKLTLPRVKNIPSSRKNDIPIMLL